MDLVVIQDHKRCWRKHKDKGVLIRLNSLLKDQDEKKAKENKLNDCSKIILFKSISSKLVVCNLVVLWVCLGSWFVLTTIESYISDKLIHDFPPKCLTLSLECGWWLLILSSSWHCSWLVWSALGFELPCTWLPRVCDLWNVGSCWHVPFLK